MDVASGKSRHVSDGDLIDGLWRRGVGPLICGGWISFGQVHWELPFIFCIIWMVVALSGIAIALLTWMIQRGEASKVSSLFYVTPPAAAFGAYLCFGETLDWHGLTGMAVVAIAIISQSSVRYGAMR
jgi:drug/metabolite transporter (DMT)-like permease